MDKKRTDRRTKSLNYEGSISLILWIFSKGMYFASIVQHYNNSKIFLQYLNYLEKWYSSEQSWKDKRLICMMDNCSSHSSGQILSKTKFLVICYIFIPIYSPQLVAVESAFNKFKWRLNRATRNKRIKLSTVDGFNSLASTLRKFTTSEIKTHFSKLYDEIHYCLTIDQG